MTVLFKYKDLIIYKAGADLRSEARRFYISYLWWIIEPILDMIVYYLVFAVLLNRGTPDYVPFLLIGITFWKWFGSSIIHASNSIIQGKGLMLQVYLPKSVFPSIVILTDTFKFGIIFAILIGYLWLYGFKPGQTYFYLPLLLGVEFLLIVAFAFFTAAITPFFPDLTIVIQHVLQIMFFVSGIFFDLDSLNPELQFWLNFNPMALLISAFRGILMYNTAPDIQGALLIAAGSLVVIGLSCALMRKFDKAYPRMVS